MPRLLVVLMAKCGGFTVDIGALRAFLPGSLVDVRPVRDTTFLEGVI
jgi:ribosomal protein S1